MIEDIIQANRERVRNYPTCPESITITTILSHSSLQIMEAANNCHFQTLGIVSAKDRATIEHIKDFPAAEPDEVLVVDDLKSIVAEGLEHVENPIFIPHGSAVQYLKLPESAYHGLELLPVPMLGNRRLFPFEASRREQRKWLENEAGLLMPREYLSADEIDGPAIVKLAGAPGGMGAVIVDSREEYEMFMEQQDPGLYEGATIQEFIPGSRMYFQFFASPLRSFTESGLEFFGCDVRKESDVDEIFKLGSRARLQERGLYPTFSVIGNEMAVVRESILLRQVMPAGKATLEASRRLAPGGLIGPYCLETVIDRDTKMRVFEISARIVAGSNVMAMGSPYGRMVYGRERENINYADRMILEIYRGAHNEQLGKVVT